LGALYNDPWQAQFADALGFRRDTVRHWVSCRSDHPVLIEKKLADLFDTQANLQDWPRRNP
jgi:hypothetical protein